VPSQQRSQTRPSCLDRVSQSDNSAWEDKPYLIDEKAYANHCLPFHDERSRQTGHDKWERGSDWEVRPSEINCEELIGAGSTSEVYRATWRGTDVAVKRMNIIDTSFNSKALQEFRMELDILSRLRHPNLVLLMGACYREPPLFVVTEFCAGGSLFELLHGPQALSRKGSPSISLSFRQRLKLSLDIAKGCVYLHSCQPQIIHRDLKSLNVILTEPIRSRLDLPNAKITDFGLSQVVSTSQLERSWPTGVGTYHWMAPEVMDGGPPNDKVDVFSFGIVLYEIMTGRIPYDDVDIVNPEDISKLVRLGRRPDLRYFSVDCPMNIRKLMEACWAHEPMRRPSFDTILSVLKDIENSTNSQHVYPVYQ